MKKWLVKTDRNEDGRILGTILLYDGEPVGLVQNLKFEATNENPQGSLTLVIHGSAVDVDVELPEEAVVVYAAKKGEDHG